MFIITACLSIFLTRSRVKSRSEVGTRRDFREQFNPIVTRDKLLKQGLLILRFFLSHPNESIGGTETPDTLAMLQQLEVNAAIRNGYRLGFL